MVRGGEVMKIKSTKMKTVDVNVFCHDCSFTMSSSDTTDYNRIKQRARMHAKVNCHIVEVYTEKLNFFRPMVDEQL